MLKNRSNYYVTWHKILLDQMRSKQLPAGILARLKLFCFFHPFSTSFLCVLLFSHHIYLLKKCSCGHVKSCQYSLGYKSLLVKKIVHPQVNSVCVCVYIYIYTHTVSHRSEYTPHIFVNIVLYLFMWQPWRNYTLLQCKVVSVQLL